MKLDLLLEHEISTVLTEVGAYQLKHWPSTEHALPFQQSLKADGSQVTSVDIYSNERIVGLLQTHFPDDGIMAEELPIPPHLNLKQNVWVLDPLDGTQSFIAGQDDFAILLARTAQTKLFCSYIFMPARNLWAKAQVGVGAFLGAQKLSVSNASQLTSASLCLRHLKLEGNSAVHPKWLDSARAFIGVASGSLSGLIVKIVRHQEWDLAAGACLVEQAGGRVSDENGNQIVWGVGGLRCKYLVVSNGHVHAELLSLLSFC